MNIETFKKQFAHLRDVDKVLVDDLCDHPKHVCEGKEIGKAPAKRNILKHGGKQFICRKCMMKHDNPMNHVGERRQTDEKITVYCPHPEHEGESTRVMTKSSYYGEMKEPYLQVCKSCAQLGREISEDQREKIRVALTGIKRSDEFKEKIRQYMKHNPEGIARATKNIIENRGTGFLGKTHSDETKQKMSEAHSGKKFTEEHCQNISEGRKRMLRETGGFSKEHREKLSKAAARQYERGFDPKLHHKSGWHKSPKAGDIFYRSSYEKKAYLILDSDDTVVNYSAEKHRIPYQHPEKKTASTYLVDIEVEYVDGNKTIIEVKPHAWLNDDVVIAKVDAAILFAEDHDMKFEVWSEVQLFGPVYNEKQIRDFIAKLEPGYKQKCKEQARKRAKKHYRSKIAKDTVEVECNFCNETHTVLRKTYEKNIARNGRYICEREGGSIAGKKSKRKKVNPYAADGKKLCNGCKEVKLFEEFGVDSSKSDGYATRCKECRRKASKKTYARH